MSTPQWKIDRDRREAAEKARREEEARKKQVSSCRELIENFLLSCDALFYFFAI